MKIKFLTIAEVQFVSYRVAKETMEGNEPIPAFESRFPNTLESCIGMPFQTFGGKVLYAGLVKKSSILFYLMVKNHPFENGNKRIAIATLFFFLARNGKWLKVDPLELYDLAKSVAASNPKWKNKTLLKIRKFLKRYIINLRAPI